MEELLGEESGRIVLREKLSVTVSPVSVLGSGQFFPEQFFPTDNSSPDNFNKTSAGKLKEINLRNLGENQKKLEIIQKTFVKLTENQEN